MVVVGIPLEKLIIRQSEGQGRNRQMRMSKKRQKKSGDGQQKTEEIRVIDTKNVIKIFPISCLDTRTNN